MTLNRHGAIPLYVQIKDRILRHIRSGEWATGQQIPSGPALASELGVSVMTIRQAISELVDEGILVSERGRGTYVAPQKHAIKLPYFMGFTEEMRLLGYKAKTLIVDRGVREADSAVAERLAIPPGSEVVWYERLRLADDEPICFEVSYFSHERFPDFPFPEGHYTSIYQVFQDKYGVEVVHAEQVLHAVKVSPKQSKMLGVPVDSPVLLLVSVEFDGSGKPIQLTEGTYRGDRYTLTFERIRRN